MLEPHQKVSGPGIPAENLDQVFERFYRIPGSPGNGCGLGLPIVSEIVRLHAATISLNRGELGGLKARLDFPAATPGQEQPEPTQV